MTRVAAAKHVHEALQQAADKGNSCQEHKEGQEVDAQKQRGRGVVAQRQGRERRPQQRHGNKRGRGEPKAGADASVGQERCGGEISCSQSS